MSKNTANANLSVAQLEPSTPAPKKFYGYTAVGDKHAFNFKAMPNSNDSPTIYIDTGSLTADRRVDWNLKITIQLTEQEIFPVLATLLGYIPECKFKYHGANRSKGFEVKRNADRTVYFNVFEANKSSHSIILTPPHLGHIIPLFFKQLLAERPWMTDTGLMMMIRQLFVSKAPPG
jgi:hypothetical protein